jgi:hypothetical protein
MAGQAQAQNGRQIGQQSGFTICGTERPTAAVLLVSSVANTMIAASNQTAGDMATGADTRKC